MEPRKHIHHKRSGLRLRQGRLALGRLLLPSLFAPPFGGAISRSPKKIGAKRHLPRFEPIWVLPNPRKRLLHNVFCHLPATEKPPEEHLHLGPMHLVKHVKGPCVTSANPLPKFAVVRQSPPSIVLFGLGLQKVHPLTSFSALPAPTLLPIPTFSYVTFN